MFWFDVHWQLQQILNLWWWPINAALLVLLGLVAYCGYKKPALAVGITIVALPTYLFRSMVWFLPLTFLELCIWATFAGWFIAGLRHRQLYVPGIRAYRRPILLILLSS